jgi:integrase
MGLVLRYVQQTTSGTWRYRRRVPDDLRPILGKAELIKKLGESKSEALKRYPVVHNAFEKALAEARSVAEQQNKIRAGLGGPFDDGVTPLGQRRAIQEDLKTKYLFDPTESGFGYEDDDQEWATREAVKEAIADKYPKDPETGYPVGVEPYDTELIRVLQAPGELEEPAPTFTDAAELYINEKVAGRINEQAKTNRAMRVRNLYIDALDGDPPLVSLKRKHARAVKSHMLDQNVSPATVRRYINDVKAIINFAIRELDIDGVTNPFNGLTVDVDSTRDERRSFTAEELALVRARVLESASIELQLVWRLLEATGCRLGEITGLLVSDVMVHVTIAHLVIQPHPHRRLKNASSRRLVPLVGDGLTAASEALALRNDPNSPLFPRYGVPRGSDKASGVLMKHVRKVAPEKSVSVHSLRHNLKDRLRLAGVPEGVHDMILGHSSGRISEVYGGPEVRLKLARDGLERALEVEL